MRTLDLDYFKPDDCYICGAGWHETKDCEYFGKPKIKFRAFHRKNPSVTLGYVEAEHRYRAGQDAQKFRSDTVPWHEIEVEEAVNA